MCPRMPTPKIEVPELATYSPRLDVYEFLLREAQALNNYSKLPINYRNIFVVANNPNLRLVMPEHNSWWWNPFNDGGAIVRLRTHGKPDRFTEALRPMTGEKIVPTSPKYKLITLTRSIQQRGKNLAIRQQAKPLFEYAIEQARADYQKSVCKLEESAVDDEGQQRLERHCRYERLRLHWLDCTYKYSLTLLPQANKDKTADVTKIRWLIKPYDVACADNLLHKMYPQSTEPEHNQRLEWWVRVMLFTCGACDDEMKDMRGDKPWEQVVRDMIRKDTSGAEKVLDDPCCS